VLVVEDDGARDLHIPLDSRTSIGLGSGVRLTSLSLKMFMRLVWRVPHRSCHRLPHVPQRSSAAFSSSDHPDTVPCWRSSTALEIECRGVVSRLPGPGYRVDLRCEGAMCPPWRTRRTSRWRDVPVFPSTSLVDIGVVT
jgi:hypothetical protein